MVLGAIIGDIIGSVHEGIGTKTKDFPLFVPRSIFTIATWNFGESPALPSDS